MKKQNPINTDKDKLRQKANAQLKKSKEQKAQNFSESEIHKLYHELQIHQIELEMQNNELIIAKDLVQEAADEKYTKLYNLSPSGYFSISKEGKIIGLNKSGATILGIEQEALINTQFDLYISDDSKQIFSKYLNSVLNSNNIETCDIILKSGNPKIKYVHLNGIVGENAEHCLVTLFDNSESKLAEIALKESEQKFKDFVNHSPNLIYKYSNLRGSLFWSDSVKSILGYSPEEIQKIPFMLINSVHPDFKALVQKAIDDDEKGTNFSIEYRIRTKSGNWIWLHNAFKNKTKVGNETIIEGYATDITARKEAELAQKISEERYRVIVETSYEGFWICDQNGKFIDVNPAFCQLVAYTREELLNMYISDIEAIESEEETKLHLAKVIELGKDRFETAHLRKDGSIVHVEIITSIIPSSNGHLVVFAHDISERKNSEKALKESELKYRFLAENISDVIWIYDISNKKFQYISPSIFQLLGYSPEELSLHGLKKFMEAETLQHIKNINRARIEEFINGTPKNYKDSVPQHCKDGTLKWVEMISKFQYATDGSIILTGVSRDVTESKSMADALHENEEHLQLLIKGTQDYYFRLKISEEGKPFMEFVSDNYYATTGKTIAQVETIESWKDIIHPDDIEMVVNSLYDIIKTGNSANFECRSIVNKNLRHIELNSFPIIDEKNGKVTYILGSVKDITLRKNAEEALLDSNKRFNTLADNLPAFVAYVNANTLEYEFVNKPYQQSFGIPIEKILGAQVKDVIGETNYQFALKHIEKVREGKTASYETVFNMIGGKRWISVNYVPDFDKNGNVASIIVLSYDITERKLVEQALFKNEIILNIVQQLSKTGGWEYDVEEQSMYWTEETYRIHEIGKPLILFGSKEHIGRGVECYNPDDRPIVLAAFNNCISKGEPYDLELPFTTFKGHHIWIKTTAKALKDSSGKITKVVGNIMDITERKNAELIIKTQNQELIKLNADKDRFITILAHDLKNPFNALMGLSELLAKNMRKYDMENIENLINVIYRTAKRTYNLLEELLLWARAQSGKLPFELQKLNLAKACDEVAEELKIAAFAKNITVSMAFMEDLNVFADINMLKTVLRNLLSNAIKFTNNGGKIDINAYQNQTKVTIAVSDNGIGMSPETVNKLFDISQTYTTKGTADETGTGLGLLLCKEFVEKHGGSISIESELGKGSSFIFTLLNPY